MVAGMVGKQVFDQGGTALDAVEQTVSALEDDPTFDAGTDGFLNQDGEVQLDALIIDGRTVDFGAIAGVRKIKNPITLARAVMEWTEQVMFVGRDADRIAKTLSINWIDNETLVIPAMRDFFEAQRLVVLKRHSENACVVSFVYRHAQAYWVEAMKD